MSRAARLGAMWSGVQGTPLSEFAQGDIVKLKEDGVLKEFVVAKHGYPTADNGLALLLREFSIESRQWHTSDVNNYATSAIDGWLNDTYYNKFDANIRELIAEVSIRVKFANYSRRAFLLSYTEAGGTDTGSFYAEGEGLGLFATNADRICYRESDEVAATYYLRTASKSNTDVAVRINSSGQFSDASAIKVTTAYMIRPALTLPSSILVDENGNIIA